VPLSVPLCKFFFYTERHRENTENHRVFYFHILRKMKIPNLLLIAGTGTNSGKTSLACRIIESFPGLPITAIKITPHFHETTPGLILKSEKDGYTIYEETNRDSSKDTSRMIRAGAAKVYIAKVKDNKLAEAFYEIMKEVPEGSPVICESPALRNFVEPGVFIIMTSEVINKHKDIIHLQDLPHLSIKLEELEEHENISVGFEHGKWINMV